jgi:tRNA-2-methylthio-N6-dimethylallyladenosine synthase
MDDALIAAHRDLAELMPYLHLPVQAGSDRILKAMNRRHTGADYLGLVERIRSAKPDIAMSGDFIVGFPGETDADFEATMQIVRDVGYASAFSFKYSPRPGTPGAEMKDQVPEAEGREAAEAAGAVAGTAACVRHVADRQDGFRADRKAGRQAGQIVGRSPWLQPVIVDEKAGRIGDIIDAQTQSCSQQPVWRDRLEGETFERCRIEATARRGVRHGAHCSDLRQQQAGERAIRPVR